MAKRDIEEDLLQPLKAKPSLAWYAFVALLTGIVGWGFYAWYVQLTHGLVVTGLRDTIFWGVYIVNFVFFIGVAHVGALVSGILRLSKVKWGPPLTRMAEVITMASLPIAALMPLIDLGRFDRILNVIWFGRLESPIVWDFIAISTYLIGSTIFLYVPLIPDLAICRDRLDKISWWRRKLYSFLALSWQWTKRQRIFIEKAIHAMSVVIIAIVFMVHTVVSFIFAQGGGLRAGWNSSIFGPYFVLGAVLSGVAALIVAMWIIRRLYHFENYLTYEHFKMLGLLLLALDLGYIYFTANEYIKITYNMPKAERGLITALSIGDAAVAFWFSVIGGLVIPALIIGIPKTRSIPGIVIASVLIFVGLWVKRWIIIVPVLANPFLEVFAIYTPTWVEWSITAGGFAGFLLLFTLFCRYFPIISVWEVAETLPKEGGKHQ
jgi:molybdopterin-containing oxidoreductase family membrane subunit